MLDDPIFTNPTPQRVADGAGVVEKLLNNPLRSGGIPVSKKIPILRIAGSGGAVRRCGFRSPAAESALGFREIFSALFSPHSADMHRL